MIQFANPVARLLSVWSEAEAIQTGNVRGVWATVFKVNQHDTYGILRGIGQLLVLVQQGKDLIQGINVVDKELHLKPLKEIETILSGTISFDMNWGEVRAKLNANATLEKLAFCAERIEQEQFELLIEKEELEDLLDKVNTLLKEIDATNVSPDLKKLLVENLENLRRAILEYRITGAKGLEQAINISIGSLVRRGEELKNSEGKKWGSKFWALLLHADSLTEKGLKMASYIGKLVKLLGYENGDS